MSRTNETRYMSWHETWACKSRLDTNASNDRQCWNNNKCTYQCKELIDRGGFV